MRALQTREMPLTGHYWAASHHPIRRTGVESKQIRLAIASRHTPPGQIQDWQACSSNCPEMVETANRNPGNATLPSTSTPKQLITQCCVEEDVEFEGSSDPAQEGCSVFSVHCSRGPPHLRSLGAMPKYITSHPTHYQLLLQHPLWTGHQRRGKESSCPSLPSRTLLPSSSAPSPHTASG